MQEYLSYTFTDSPAFVATFDELPLWSAPFGMLLLKHVELRRGITVLDVGCGAGFPLLELAERLGSSCKLYGIDPWTNATQRARQKLERYGIKNVELLEASAEQMPLPDGSIDLIVSNLGINNFERPHEVLLECHRILRPGGKVAITTNTQGHWSEFYRIFEGALERTGRAHLIPVLNQDEQHRATPTSMEKLLEQAGLTVARQYSDSFSMRFTDGSAFLNHHFVKLGWLTSWLGLFPKEELPAIFAALEADLNAHATKRGELLLTVPMLYVEGERVD